MSDKERSASPANEMNHKGESPDGRGESPGESPQRNRGASRSYSRSRSRSKSPKRHRKSKHSRSRSRSPRRSRRSRRTKSRSVSPYYSRGGGGGYGGSYRERSRSPYKGGRGDRDRYRSSPSPYRGRGGGGGGGMRYDNIPPNRCIGVFGLSLYTNERDLKEFFSKFGPIEDVQLVYDHPTGRSRGFGFIYFENMDDSIDAKERAAGAELDGHRIRIDFSATKRAHTPTPGIYMGRPTRRGGRDDYGGRGRSPSPYRSGGRGRSRSYSYSPRGGRDYY